jgi:hypothetical protein
MKDLHEDDMFGSVRDRLSRYEESPSDDLWGRIERAKDVPSPMWPLWLESSSLGAIAVMLVIGMSLGEGGMENMAKPAEKSIAPKSIASRENRAPMQAPTTVAVNISPESPTATQEISLTPTPIPQDPNPDTITTQETLPTQEILVTRDTLDDQQETSDIQLQTTDPKTVTPPYKKPRSKFQLFLSVTPSLSFQKIIPGTHDQVIIEDFEHRSPLSIKRFGFAIDAGFQRNINNIFGYYGALTLYRQQQELTYTYFDREANVNRIGDSWQFEINRPQHTRTFDYSMTNIGLRSGILVTLKGEKLQHKFGAGLIYSHGIAKSVGSYNNRQSSYLSYQLFYRNEVKINDRLSWFVEPTFIYGFISKEKLEEPFRLKPYRAGISAGVLYRF